MKKLFVLLMAALLITGCATKEEATPNEDTTKEETTKLTESSEDTVEEIPEGQTLTVYLNDFDAVIGDMFEEATGHKIEVFAGNGAEVMQKIAAEQADPQWDVVWADMMPSIHNMMLNGEVTTGYTPENADKLTDFAKSAVPTEQGYWPTGAHAAAVLVYRNDSFTAETAPKDILKLNEVDAKYGMANPGVAAPAYPMAAYFFEELTIPGAEEYFGGLFDTTMKIYPKNPQIVQALASGEINAALLQESNAYGMVNDGEDISILWPENGAPASVRVAAISASSEKQALAKEFVNFLLDPAVQQELIDTGDEAYFEPSVTGVEMKADRKADNPTLTFADPKWAADNEAEIKNWFADSAAE